MIIYHGNCCSYQTVNHNVWLESMLISYCSFTLTLYRANEIRPLLFINIVSLSLPLSLPLPLLFIHIDIVPLTTVPINIVSLKFTHSVILCCANETRSDTTHWHWYYKLSYFLIKMQMRKNNNSNNFLVEWYHIDTFIACDKIIYLQHLDSMNVL